MRRVFLLYFLWVICLITPGIGRAERPWGVLSEFVEDTHHKYAMDALIFQTPVFYKLSDEITIGQEAAFIQALTSWPRETLQFIKKSKHKRQFKDIIPLLEGSVRWQKTDKNYYILFSTGKKCGPAANGCLITDTGGPFEMIITEGLAEGEFLPTVLHEMGHYYGLSDQYDHVPARRGSHAEYSSDANQQEKSIMHGSDGPRQFTCDDADGFINLLDLRLAQHNKGKFSKRAQKGWKSLCPKSNNFYQAGRTITRNRIDLLRYPKPNLRTLKEAQNGQFEKGQRTFDLMRSYDKGNLEAEMLIALPDRTLLFDTGQDSVVTRNKKTGVITSIKTPLSVYEIDKSKATDSFQYFADYKPSDRKVFWTREFAYARKQEAGRKSYILTVKDSIAGISQGQFELEIAEDGWVGGNNTPISIYKNKYTAYLPAQAWKLKVVLDKDRNMEQFFIESRDEANKLSGTAKAPSLQAVIDGESMECSAAKFPTGKCEEIADYWVTYHNHLRNIKSFYQNFYNPFFSTQLEKQKAQQVINKVKKDLNRRTGKAAASSAQKKNSRADQAPGNTRKNTNKQAAKKPVKKL